MNEICTQAVAIAESFALLGTAGRIRKASTPAALQSAIRALYDAIERWRPASLTKELTKTLESLYLACEGQTRDYADDLVADSEGGLIDQNDIS